MWQVATAGGGRPRTQRPRDAGSTRGAARHGSVRAPQGRRHRRALVGWGALVNALALGALAQRAFAERSGPGPGAALYGLAVLFMFVYGWARPWDGGEVEGRAIGRPAAPGPSLWLGAVRLGSSVVLVVWTLRLIARGAPLALQISAWLLSMVAFDLAWWPRVARGPVVWLREVWAAHGRDVIIAGTLLLVALAARLYGIGRIPYSVHLDEGGFGFQAYEVLERGEPGPFTTGYDGHPALYSYLTAAAVALRGHGVDTLRSVSACMGALYVVAIYALALTLFGRWPAVIAGLLMAGAYWPVHFSRLAQNDLQVGLPATVMCIFLARGALTGRAACFARAGLLLGISQYFGNKGEVLPAMVGLTFLYLTLARWRLDWRRYGSLPALVSGFLVAFAPLAYDSAREATRHTVLLGAFFNKSVLFQNQDFRLDDGRLDVLGLMWNQVHYASLVFNYYVDPVFMNIADRPLLGPVTGMFFVLGLGYAVWRWRVVTCALPVSWFAAGMLGSLLGVNPLLSQRIAVIVGLPFVFAALALEQVRGLLATVLRSERRAFAVVLPLILVAVIVEIGPYLRRAAAIGGDHVWQSGIGRLVRRLGDEGHVVQLIGLPDATVRFASTALLCRGVEAYDHVDIAEVVPFGADVPRRVALVWPQPALDPRPLAEYVYPGGQGYVQLLPDLPAYRAVSYSLSEEQIRAKQGLWFRAWGDDARTPLADERTAGLRLPAGPVAAATRLEWTGSLFAPETGRYQFQVQANAPYAFSLDGEAVAGTETPIMASERELLRGWHRLTLELRPRGGVPEVELYWAPPWGILTPIPGHRLHPDPLPQGVVARFYTSAGWSGDPVETRLDPTIAYRNPLDEQRPIRSALWTGWVEVPADDRYTFAIHTNGSARLWVADREVIPSRTQGEWREGRIDLAAGRYPLALWASQADALRAVTLGWSSTRQPERVLVPPAAWSPRSP